MLLSAETGCHALYCVARIRRALCCALALWPAVWEGPAHAACSNLPAGVVSWWAAENDARDSYGGNDGDWSDGFAAGFAGSAFDFRAPQFLPRVKIPASASLDVGSGEGFAIEMWIKPGSVSSAFPLAVWHDGTNAGVSFSHSVDVSGQGGAGRLYANIVDDSLTSHIIYTMPGIVKTGVWQHVALSYDSTDGVGKFFWNGAEVTSSNLGSFTPLTSTDFYLGYKPGDGSFNGLLDEVWLYSRALSPAEIYANFVAGPVRNRGIAPVTNLFTEDFESGFPAANGWFVADLVAAGTPAYWGAVNFDFGGEGTHGGSWKAYCAGVGFGGNTNDPVYQDNMRAVMSRTVDLSGLARAQVSFWHKVPSIEGCCDRCRVFVDNTSLSLPIPNATADWTFQALDLSAFVGGTHTLKFQFDSDISTTAEGWYLDDIRISGNPPAPDALPIGLAAGAPNQIVLSWPAVCDSAVMQECPDLSGTNWVDVAQTPVSDGVKNTLTLSPGATRKFYRLRQ